MQLRFLIPLGIFALAPPGAASSARITAGPPNSFKPAEKKRTLRVSHRHHRVRTCTPGTAASQSRCAPVLEDADSAASVGFERVMPPNTTNDDASRSIVVTFPSRIGVQESRLELPLGQWLVDWSGYPSIRRLRITATSSPHISLHTTSGRCELRGNECRKSDEVSRRMRIIDDRR
jgi:hypothetical protein